MYTKQNIFSELMKSDRINLNSYAFVKNDQVDTVGDTVYLQHDWFIPICFSDMFSTIFFLIYQ